MRFPIDTSSLRLFVVGVPESLAAHGNHHALGPGSDEHAEQSWRVPLRALGDSSGQIVRVTVAGDPQLEPGAEVTVEGMSALTRRHSRCGMSLCARAITTERGPAAPEAREEEARMTSAPRRTRNPADNTRGERDEIRARRPSSVMPMRAAGRQHRPAATRPNASASDPADASVETVPARTRSTAADDVTACYRDGAGVEHELRVELSPNGFWRVLDVGADGARLVEELTGFDDHRPQAEALARDYAEQAERAARGEPDGEHQIVWAA